MKKKVFASLGIGMLLAMGGAALVGHGPIEAANAVPSTLRFYVNSTACIDREGLQATDPAKEKFAIYYFGGSSTATFVDTVAVDGATNVLYADVPAVATTVIVVRYDATKEVSWESKWNQTADITITNFNYVKLTGYDGEGKINYETSSRAMVRVLDGTDGTTIKTVDFYDTASTDPYVPSYRPSVGTKYASFYENNGLTSAYAPAKITADCDLYVTESEFDNTATLYVKKYGDWADHKLYVWETIQGANYYLRGGFADDSTKMASNEVLNVKFDGDGMFKVTFKYHDAANVRMILHDGTDSNKSATATFTNNTFVRFDSNNAGQLESNADLFVGADMAYAICSQMTATGVSTNYGNKDYTVCSLKNNASVKAALIAKYNAMRENVNAKAAFDAATLNTYVYGEGDQHFVNYGEVSFVNVINEIAGYDIVSNTAAPSAFNVIKNSSNPFLALIIGGGIICLGAAAMLILRKKKLAK